MIELNKQKEKEEIIFRLLQEKFAKIACADAIRVNGKLVNLWTQKDCALSDLYEHALKEVKKLVLEEKNENHSSRV